MPGKVKPTQWEAMIRVCLQVVANDDVRVAKRALEHGMMLRKAAIASGRVSGEAFCAWVPAEAMTGPDVGGQAR